MTRREAREQAFILMFEKSFQTDIDINEMIESSIENGFIEKDEFAGSLAIKTCENIDEIDGIIEKFSVARKLNRISRVSLAILRVAICEMKYFDDIPVGVSINEAVEICKKYASEDEYSFVNGLLGSYSKSIEAK